MSHTLHLFQDGAGEWRWHRKASNGEIISDSSEGYVRKEDALHGMRIANADWPIIALNEALDPRVAHASAMAAAGLAPRDMTPAEREVVLESIYQTALLLASSIPLTVTPDEFAQSCRDAFEKSLDDVVPVDQVFTDADIDDESDSP